MGDGWLVSEDVSQLYLGLETAYEVPYVGAGTHGYGQSQGTSSRMLAPVYLPTSSLSRRPWS